MKIVLAKFCTLVSQVKVESLIIWNARLIASIINLTHVDMSGSEMEYCYISEHQSCHDDHFLFLPRLMKIVLKAQGLMRRRNVLSWNRISSSLARLSKLLWLQDERGTTLQLRQVEIKIAQLWRIRHSNLDNDSNGGSTCFYVEGEGCSDDQGTSSDLVISCIRSWAEFNWKWRVKTLLPDLSGIFSTQLQSHCICEETCCYSLY